MVNLTTLLGPSTGLVDPFFTITAVEFLDDGSLLVEGNASPGADVPVVGPTPSDIEIVQVVATLNPDGTLNQVVQHNGNSQPS